MVNISKTRGPKQIRRQFLWKTSRKSSYVFWSAHDLSLLKSHMTTVITLGSNILILVCRFFLPILHNFSTVKKKTWALAMLLLKSSLHHQPPSLLIIWTLYALYFDLTIFLEFMGYLISQYWTRASLTRLLATAANWMLKLLTRETEFSNEIFQILSCRKISYWNTLVTIGHSSVFNLAVKLQTGKRLLYFIVNSSQKRVHRRSTGNKTKEKKNRQYQNILYTHI